MKPARDPAIDADLHNPARGVRLQRVLADLGVAARRVCERIIEEGRVEINGKVVRKLPIFVDPGNDHIAVDGRPLPKIKNSRRVYVMLHKPERTLTVSSDEPGADRATVLDLVQHPSAPRLYPVGRLEYESTGLVLLTNDGELANKLSHPRYGVAKIYHAVVKGEPSEHALKELEQEIFDSERKAARTQTRMQAAGVKFKGEVPRQLRTSKPIKGIYRAAHVKLRIVKRAAGKTMIEITLTEGRNRHVDGIFAAHGFPIRKMTQVGLGPLELSGLPVGAWRELDREEVVALSRSVKDGKSNKQLKTGSKRNRHNPELSGISAGPINPRRAQNPPGSSKGGNADANGDAAAATPPNASRPANSRRNAQNPPASKPPTEVPQPFRPMIRAESLGLTSNRKPRVIGKKPPSPPPGKNG